MLLSDTATSNILGNLSALEVFAAFLAIIVSYILFHKDKALELRKERFDNFIQPLFTTIEPYLYQPVLETEAQEIIEYIHKKHKYADGKLLHCLLLYTEDTSHRNWKRLCHYIDFLYDSYSLKLYFPLRTVTYRLKKKQYYNLFFKVILCIGSILYFIRIPVLGSVIIYLGSNAIINLFPTASFIVYIAIFIFLLLCIFWLIYEVKR